MQGINPFAYMQQVASRLNNLNTRTEVETVLDEIEYLYEVMDPELQPLADDLIARLRERLQAVP